EGRASARPGRAEARSSGLVVCIFVSFACFVGPPLPLLTRRRRSGGRGRRSVTSRSGKLGLNRGRISWRGGGRHYPRGNINRGCAGWGIRFNCQCRISWLDGIFWLDTDSKFIGGRAGIDLGRKIVNGRDNIQFCNPGILV